MAGETKAPAFQLYARDWITSTVTLDLAAQGLFIRFLCHQWIEGPLPPEAGKLARIAGVTLDEFKQLWSQIEESFCGTDSGLICERLERYRAERLEYHRSLSERGKKGVVARAAKKRRAELDQASPEPSVTPAPKPSSESRGKARLKPELSPSPATSPSPPIPLADSDSTSLPTSPELQIGESIGDTPMEPNQRRKSPPAMLKSNATDRIEVEVSNNIEQVDLAERERLRQERRVRLLTEPV